jgi:hypothetical protein
MWHLVNMRASKIFLEAGGQKVVILDAIAEISRLLGDFPFMSVLLRLCFIQQ